MHSRRAKVHDNLGNRSLISAQARRNLLIFWSTYPGIAPETGDWERKAMSNGEYGGKRYVATRRSEYVLDAARIVPRSNRSFGVVADTARAASARLCPTPGTPIFTKR